MPSLTDAEGGLALRIGSLQFSVSNDARAIGLLCFAYGLDHELFHSVDPQSDVRRWLIWHVSALLSRREVDPDMPTMLQQALEGAFSLAPDDSTTSEVRARVRSRLLAIEQHHGPKLTTLQALQNDEAGEANQPR